MRTDFSKLASDLHTHAAVACTSSLHTLKKKTKQINVVKRKGVAEERRLWEDGVGVTGFPPKITHRLLAGTIAGAVLQYFSWAFQRNQGKHAPF